MMHGMIQCENGHSFDPHLHGRICPYCSMMVPGDKRSQALPRTQEELEAELAFFRIEPVCGWLACIDGPQTGQSFILHRGKNFIGKDEEVAILGDAGVAARNHASIAYDAKNREFMLVPGESEGIVYLNGKSVFHAARLVDMNRITVGSTTLLFKPLCGENFAWTIENTPDFGDTLYSL